MKRTLIVVVLALTVAIAGCGGPGDAPEDNESPGEPGEGPGGEPAEDPGEGEDGAADGADGGAALLTGASTVPAIGIG